ncbi:Spermidine synthase N-terminal extension / Spermidine synthase (EC [Olavius algarvensis associated proteobacterium Delta 3]|nr:Spermidine synthase N-terminal extension / Spermidine synthase (EC [Olavius algarvensis associated proteobacterium Delta 3]
MKLTASPTAAPVILLGSVFVVAACGLVYELVAGAVSSYILGNAVTQFSLVVGVFLSSMGIGSFLAKYIRTNLLKMFIEIEIWIALIGGGSSMIMFMISAFADDLFQVFFYLLCISIGVLIGIEIPLIVRIVKERHGFSGALSNVLALDYIGALVGALLFPLVVLPYLGLSRASVVFGIMNLSVAAAGWYLLTEKHKSMLIKILVTGLVLLLTLIFSGRWVGFLEDLLYQDSIIYTKDTPYQRIIMTRWRDDVRLYLNGHIQFSSIDEARYHEALVMPAMAACPTARSVLILGGGDGMAAREVLKYDRVQSITLIDIDPVMTDLGKTRKELLALNGSALNSKKVQIHNTDAMVFLRESRDFFDAILIDLPDPNTPSLTKLYSKAFYTLCFRRLNLGGVLSTQATSPFYAKNAFWCIVETMTAAGGGRAELSEMAILPYHLNVPSFGEWGFVLASRRAVDPKQLSIPVSTRFLTDDVLHAMFSFGRDMAADQEIEVNRIDRPVLYEYYRKGWNAFNE